MLGGTRLAAVCGVLATCALVASAATPPARSAPSPIPQHPFVTAPILLPSVVLPVAYWGINAIIIAPVGAVTYNQGGADWSSSLEDGGEEAVAGTNNSLCQTGKQQSPINIVYMRCARTAARRECRP